MNKKWWKSKTLWFNAIGLLIVIAEYFGQINIITPELLALILLLGNGVLRMVTTSGIEKSIK